MMAEQKLISFLENLKTTNDVLKHMPRKIVWLSGAPGAGKGTNENYIIEYAHLSQQPLIASSLLNSPEMRAKINQGLLLDDLTVVSSVFNGLMDPIYQSGVLVDGFPRTLGQAQSIAWLYKQLIDSKIPVNFSVIVLMLDEEESVRRQLHRGQRCLQYNERIRKSGQGVQKEVRQTDLDPVVARQRYKVFMKETYLALESLKELLPFVTISSNGSLETVKTRVLEAIQQLKLIQ